MERDQVELSPEFREALEALPRGRAPSPGLEDRMAQALRRRGLIRADHRTAGRRPVWTAVLQLAAALVILAGGVVLGHWLGSRPTSPEVVPVAASSTWELAAVAQHTGSMHAAALRDLANRVASAQPEEIELAREVALASLRAALLQVALLDLSDPTPIRLLTELEATGTGSPVPVRAGNEPWLVSF